MRGQVLETMDWGEGRAAGLWRLRDALLLCCPGGGGEGGDGGEGGGGGDEARLSALAEQVWRQV